MHSLYCYSFAPASITTVVTSTVPLLMYSLLLRLRNLNGTLLLASRYRLSLLLPAAVRIIQSDFFFIFLFANRLADNFLTAPAIVPSKDISCRVAFVVVWRLVKC